MGFRSGTIYDVEPQISRDYIYRNFLSPKNIYSTIQKTLNYFYSKTDYFSGKNTFSINNETIVENENLASSEPQEIPEISIYQSPAEANIPENPQADFTCRTMSYEDSHTLQCGNSHFHTTIFLKPSEATSISTCIESGVPKNYVINSDIFDASTCRPIEFFGQPSVFCEGKKTAVVYTPHLQRRPFDNIDCHLMLGAVWVHFLKKGYNWMAGSTSSAIGSKSVIAGSGYAKRTFEYLENELRQVNYWISENTNDGDFGLAKEALEIYHEELIRLQEKYSVSLFELDEIKLDILHFKREVIGELEAGEIFTEITVQNNKTSEQLSRFGIFPVMPNTDIFVSQNIETPTTTPNTCTLPYLGK